MAPPLAAGELSRRLFLKWSGAAAATLLASGAWTYRAGAAEAFGGLKLGLQSYSLRNFKFEAALQHIAELGLGYVEAFPGHLPLNTVPAYLKEQKAMLDKAGVALKSYGVVSFDENETKAREFFEFAKAFGLASISCDPKKNAATFDLLDKLVEEYQIPVAIHNHGPGHRYDKVADVLDMVRDRHPLIGACVDTGHYLRSNEDPVAVIQQLGARVFGVHLKDVRTIHSDKEKAKLLAELPEGRAKQLEKEGKIFTILGEGELNTVGVIRALRQLGYDRPVSIEYEENPANPLSDIELCVSAVRDAVAYLDDPEEGFVSIWDGQSFENWTENEKTNTFKIENGELIVNGPRSHLFYSGSLAPFRNFEFKADVMAKPNSNSGIYFHTKFQPDGWPAAGFETQVNNTYNVDPRKTGSLYAVSDVKRQLIPDNTWWTQHIIVQGNRVIIKIDGKVAVDYTEPADAKKTDNPFERKFNEGTFALQGHDPGSTVHFKNIRVKKLPD